MSKNDTLWMDGDLDASDVPNAMDSADLNGDGVMDYFTQTVDSDLDGVTDTENSFMDSDGDGFIDTVFGMVDSNQDGIADTETMSSDLNGDGLIDMVTQTMYLDSDQNGIVDTISYAQDTNGDGYFDVATFAQDVDMDGLFDIVISSQNAIQSMPALDPTAPGNDPDSGTDPVDSAPDTSIDDDGIVGDPADDMENWHLQETDSSCAVCAQEFVLEELLDRDFTEEELRDFAEQNGWYSENGTPMEDVGNILEAYGLQVNKHEGGSIEDIEKCLDNGGSVIVGLDADEIWYGDNDIFGPGDDANHAVEVIGVDYSDPDNPMVILNDSGTPDGCGSEIPLDQFMDAWEDSNCFMVEAYK